LPALRCSAGRTAPDSSSLRCGGQEWVDTWVFSVRHLKHDVSFKWPPQTAAPCAMVSRRGWTNVGAWGNMHQIQQFCHVNRKICVNLKPSSSTGDDKS
jgi:hypothetical protein